MIGTEIFVKLGEFWTLDFLKDREFFKSNFNFLSFGLMLRIELYNLINELSLHILYPLIQVIHNLFFIKTLLNRVDLHVYRANEYLELVTIGL